MTKDDAVSPTLKLLISIIVTVLIGLQSFLLARVFNSIDIIEADVTDIKIEIAKINAVSEKIKK